MNFKNSFFLIFVFLISCQKKQHQAGICLSFDDRTVKEWFSLRDIFKQYDVHATFFITQFDSLSAEEIEMLHTLERDGHEIGSHGALHIEAEKYIKKYSYKKYLANEIKPSIASMKKNGFNPVSFAYPYGAKYWFTDYLLSHKFKCTRGVADLRKEKDLTKHNELFFDFDGNRKFTALSIDQGMELSKEMLLKAIHRAEEKNEALLLFAHQPNKGDNNEYSFDVDFLKFILDEAYKRNFKFYRFKDLTN